MHVFRKCNEATDETDYTSVAAQINTFVARVSLFRNTFSGHLKTKQGPVVALAIKEILDEAKSRIDCKIKKIQADQGKEFYNKHVRELLETRYIQLFSTSSPTKTQMAERLTRTLRSHQERFNTFRGK